MNDILANTAGNLALTGGAILAFLVGLAATLPKVMNGIKGDQLNGNVLDRLKAMEEHARQQDEKSVKQDTKIHDCHIKITKLAIVMMRLEGLLRHHDIAIPADLEREIMEIKTRDGDV